MKHIKPRKPEVTVTVQQQTVNIPLEEYASLIYNRAKMEFVEELHSLRDTIRRLEEEKERMSRKVFRCAEEVGDSND